MSSIPRIRSAQLSLDDFVLEMAHIPSRDLELATLKDLFGRLDLKDELIQEHIHFVPGSYARNLVCRTPRFDMLVLCWKPGHVTTVHDHAGSLNVTRVFDGELTSRIFEEGDRPGPGRCLVRLRNEERLARAGFSCVDHGEIHQLANTSGRDLVTVHVYARPLKDITVYCPASGEIERVALRYTLEDEFA
jgi:predicted metal-dependent enzyme (double-stranded beta helix superfamily)